ncbi:MAG: class D beta-lactamase [bacterium]|nr:class D beta-lactamase [bacterium]
MRAILLGAALALAAGAARAEPTWQPRPDWESLFADAGVTGTILVADERSGEQWVWNAVRAAERFCPASTFKVPHALFALDAGVLRDEFTRIPWDRAEHRIAGWNADQTLRSSMRHSTVWVYQQFARELGAERERAYLEKLGYGNRTVGDDVTTFWLDGSLRISAVEQMEFLRRLYRNELPFAVEHQRLVKDVMINEAGRDRILRAKTGWQARSERHLGWWVGWVETPEGAVFFVLNIDMPQGGADAPKREAIGRAVLGAVGALP